MWNNFVAMNRVPVTFDGWVVLKIPAVLPNTRNAKVAAPENENRVFFLQVRNATGREPRADFINRHTGTEPPNDHK